MGGKRLFQQDIDKYCKKNKLICIGPYITQQKSCKWLCTRHDVEFITNFKNIKIRKSGCIKCQIIKIRMSFSSINKRHSIDDVIVFLNKKRPNARLLTNTYVNQYSKLKIMCENNHKFITDYVRIKFGNWCPYCVIRKSENIVREIFEKKFNKSFKIIRPNFLKNPKTGRNLELDGYCEELKLAFEYDGRMHYEERVLNPTIKQIKRHSNLSIIQERDKLKEKLCKQAGVILIRIPYKVDDLKEYTLKAINNLKE